MGDEIDRADKSSAGGRSKRRDYIIAGALAAVLVIGALVVLLRDRGDGGTLYDQATPIKPFEPFGSEVYDGDGEAPIERLANLALSNINCMVKRPPGSRAECRSYLVEPGSPLDGDIDVLVDSGDLGEGDLKMTGLAGYDCCDAEGIIDLDIAGEGRHLKVILVQLDEVTSTYRATNVYWIDD